MTMGQLYQAFREQDALYLEALRTEAGHDEIKKIGCAMDQILDVIKQRFELRKTQFDVRFGVKSHP